jgi:hypothetical protein
MKLCKLHNTSGICGCLCRHGILAMVLLYIAEAWVLTAGYLLIGILHLWCCIVVEVTSKFHGLVAEAVGAMEWALAARVEVAMGGVWVSA